MGRRCDIAFHRIATRWRRIRGTIGSLLALRRRGSPSLAEPYAGQLAGRRSSARDWSRFRSCRCLRFIVRQRRDRTFPAVFCSGFIVLLDFVFRVVGIHPVLGGGSAEFVQAAFVQFREIQQLVGFLVWEFHGFAVGGEFDSLDDYSFHFSVLVGDSEEAEQDVDLPLPRRVKTQSQQPRLGGSRRKEHTIDFRRC